MTLLSLKNISYKIEDKLILKDVSLSLNAKEIVGILGRNGSGKSTLLSILSGLISNAQGEIRFNGENVSNRSVQMRTQTGVVFQKNSLDLKLSPEQNLRLAGMLFGLSGTTLSQRIDVLLDAANLKSRRHEPTAVLSGGMQRRLDILRALLPQPKLLLLDEPTSGLDEVAFRETWDMLQFLKKNEGVAMLLATHRPEEADHCERLLFLSQGELIAEGTPQNLRQRVGENLIAIKAVNAVEIKSSIEQKFNLPCYLLNDEIFVTCQSGHTLLPRIVESFEAGRLASLSLRQPSMADVFLHLTGAQLTAG